MFATFRNNPKKSIFFAVAVVYGGYYCDNKFKEYQYRRRVCNLAKEGGDELIAPMQELTRVTVVYNPIANNRRCSTIFKKDVYPLLNLNGYKVTLAETERPEEGKELMSILKINEQDCVCVAGGDGTLMEVITGLLRREDLKTKIKEIPLLLIPLGQTNSFAKRNNLIKTDDSIGTYDEAVKLIRKGQVKPYNVIELQIEGDESNETTGKKSKEIYAISGLEWSVDRDVTKIGKGKWVFGPFRYHWQYLVSGLFGKHIKSNKSATLIYQEHCSGCSKCVSSVPSTQLVKSKFSLAYLFFPMYYKDSVTKERQITLDLEEKLKVINDNCGVVHQRALTDVRGLSVVLDKDELKVKIDKMELRFFAFIKSGIDRLLDIPYNMGDESQETFNCSTLQIIPDKISDEHFYVDNEKIDVVPLKLRVLKDAVFFYV